MKPVDPRLVRAAPSLRGYLVRLGVLGAAGAGLVIAQATLLADLVARGFVDHAPLRALTTELVVLAAVTLGRAALAWAACRAGEVASPRVAADVRAAALHAVARAVAGAAPGSPRPVAGEVAVTVGAGLDGMDAYLTRFLPSMVAAVLVPPAVLARLALADPASTVILALALPLVPVFMALVGIATRAHTDRQRGALELLAGHFLDVVTGLPTLRMFRRAEAQVEVIRRVTDAYRQRTMAALRAAFLSSFVLDLLATLSVALVAVSIGLRLISGDVSLRTALLVLLLAPEVFLPVRQMGAQYHATEAGVAAAHQALTMIDTARPAPQSRPVPRSRPAAPAGFDALTLHEVRLVHPDRPVPALDGVDLTIRAGEIVALVGPSGAGKTSILSLLRGAARPSDGAVLVDGRDLAELDNLPDLADAGRRTWSDRVAWLPQRPTALTDGAVADAVRVGRPDASDADVAAAIAAAGAPAADTPVGADGRALSAGELRRVALARVLVRQAPLVLLDEPSESLDHAAADRVAAAIDGLRGRTTVVFVAHAASQVRMADRVVTVREGRVAGEAPGWCADVRPFVPAPASSAAAVAANRIDVAYPRPAAAFAPVGPATPVRAGAPAEPAGGFATAFRPAWRPTALGVLAGTAALGCGIGLTATAAWLISRAAQHPPVLTLMVAVVAVRAFGLGRAAFRYAERLSVHDGALRGLANLRARVFAGLVPLTPGGLPGWRRGDLLRRFTEDVDEIGAALPRGIVPIVTTALAATGAVVVVGVALPPAGPLLAVGLLAVGLLVAPVTAQRARAAGDAAAVARADRDATIVDLVEHLDELVAYGAHRSRLDAVRAHDTQLVALAGSGRRSPAVAAAAGALVCGLTTVAVLMAGVAAVGAGRMSGVLLAVVVLTTLAAFEPVGALTDACAAVFDARRCAGRVRAVLAAEPSVRPPDHPVPLPLERGGPAGGTGPLGIRFDRVGLRYGATLPPVLRDLDLSVPAGCRVALVGPSGVGKSSVVALATRSVDPTGGRVLVGGVDLRDAGEDDLHRAVSGLTSDAHVFDATLGDNLRIARPDATDGNLEQTLAQVDLGGWLGDLPAGLDTRLGVGGERMSGGQRQRVLLARALLADPAILVLDEPTAHLDPETEADVMASILRATAGRTVLLVTHRPTGLDQFDAVVALSAPAPVDFAVRPAAAIRATSHG